MQFCQQQVKILQHLPRIFYRHVFQLYEFYFFCFFLSLSLFLYFQKFVAALLQQSPPGMISMAGGMPNVDTFPFKSASLELR